MVTHSETATLTPKHQPIKEVKRSSDRDMPDIAKSTLGEHRGTLDWVGMSKIALPIQFQDSGQSMQNVNTKAQIFVNLNNPKVKGIHMSRLYLVLTDFAQQQHLSPPNIRKFLLKMLESHEDISDRAKLVLRFDYLINQPALKSGYEGWKAYPTQISAEVDADQVNLEVAVEVPYSSTCPCSAALARQLLQQAFARDFVKKAQISKEEVEQWLRSEKGASATPHSQRSAAKVIAKLNSNEDGFQIKSLIDLIESTLATPVQTAVKREDEQEFARLNGENMMFCEDAARRLKTALNKSKYSDFWLKVEHYESLHAHDAVAVATKGLSNGYTATLNRSL